MRRRALHRLKDGAEYLSIIALLALFAAADWWLRSLVDVSYAAYEHPVIFAAVIREHFAQPSWCVVPLILVLCLLIWRYREAWIAWNEFEHARAIRLLVAAACLPLGWIYSTYGYLRAPPILWTFSSRREELSGSLERIRVHQVLSGYIGGRYVEIRSIPLLEVDIPPAG